MDPLPMRALSASAPKYLPPFITDTVVCIETKSVEIQIIYYMLKNPSYFLQNLLKIFLYEI